ncbi:IclR family transcriptional regulator [Agrococcus casei]|uniref:IclR family transcriptional regulator n=1 Tax=Agrococcus casei TaxID=343512 RepID=UPI003F9215EA
MTVRMPAARNALRVLMLLAEQVGPVRAATVARELDIPRSSAYQLLQVMREEGFLVHYPELGAFGPSARVREIGSRVGAATRLERLGQPVLDRLMRASAIPATAHLAVLAGRDVAYAARAQGRRSPTTVSRVGVRLVALATATGRSLLAALDDDQVLALTPKLPVEGADIRTRAQLRELLSGVRMRGYAVEEGDVDASYGSVAAAAFDAAGYPVAAVGLTFRLDALGADQWEALGEAVREAARELTRRLGGQPA